MSTIRKVEKQIKNREGFRVAIHFSGPGGKRGRDVRGDKSGIKRYGYVRKLAGRKTVSDWISGRFNKTYPGYSVQVLDGNGKPVHGGTQLKTVRATYRS